MSLPTTALFRDDFYLSTHEAVVTAVHEDGGIELDQTCFYATSGGQPGDTGFLERSDGSRIALGPAVTGATILGAVCVYLLLGMFFAYAFRMIDAFAPPFFAHGAPASSANVLYYSYASLTTVGYGDFTAEPEFGRRLSVTEALMGQLYLVTIVALLVGNIGRTRERIRSGSQGTQGRE